MHTHLQTLESVARYYAGGKKGEALVDLDKYKTRNEEKKQSRYELNHAKTNLNLNAITPKLPCLVA